MDHAERMMIAGLALQGLLANPNTPTPDVAGNIRQALNYAQALGVQMPDENGEALASKALRAARIAYGIYIQGPEFSELSPVPWTDQTDDVKEDWYDNAAALFTNTPLPDGVLSLGPTSSAILKCVVAAWE